MAKLIATGTVTATAAGAVIPAAAAVTAAQPGIRGFLLRLRNRSASVIAYVHPATGTISDVTTSADALGVEVGSQPLVWTSPPMSVDDGDVRVASAGDAATVSWSAWALTQELP